MLQLPTLLLPHPFIHLMLDLLFLPHTILLQCCLFTHPLMILFTLNILLSQLLPLSTPLLLHSAGHSLHRSVIDMSSIHHAPTAEDYLHPTTALASTYRHAVTSLRPLLLLLSIIILQLMLPHHLPPFNYLLLHFILQCICFHIHPPPPGSVLPPVETLG